MGSSGEEICDRIWGGGSLSELGNGGVLREEIRSLKKNIKLKKRLIM